MNKASANITSLLELMDITTELKSYLKGLSGSNFLVNRRVIDRGIRGREKKKREG